MPFLAGFHDGWHDATAYLDAHRRDLAEGRRLDLLPERLSETVTVEDGAARLVGPEAAGMAIAARLAALPGLSHVREELIWSAPAADALVAAQRFLCRARHDGAGLYGPATGRALSYLCLGEIYSVAGRVRAEWIVRDEAAILSQLGIPLMEGARLRLSQLPAAAPGGPLPDPGPGNDDAWGHTLGDLVHRVMGGELSVIARHYDAAAELCYPGGVTGSGPAEAEAFWLGLRAALPSARFRVHHLLGAEDPLSPPRAAIRWSLSGRHDGHGVLGAPTGAEVTVLGLTQAEFGPAGLRREWTLYDVPGTMAQVLRSTG